MSKSGSPVPCVLVETLSKAFEEKRSLRDCGESRTTLAAKTVRTVRFRLPTASWSRRKGRLCSGCVFVWQEADSRALCRRRSIQR